MCARSKNDPNCLMPVLENYSNKLVLLRAVDKVIGRSGPAREVI